MPPTALIQSIDAVRRRARLLSVLYGVGIVVASAVALLASVVLIDYLLNLQSVPRLLAVAASLGTVGYLIYRYVTTPALSVLSRSDIAGRLERTFPQFEDRLRSTVNFADSPNPGSTVLQQRVIEQASGIAQGVNFADAVVAKPAIVSIAAAAAAIGLVTSILFGVLSDNVRSIIAARLFTPFSAPAWPKRVQIDMMSSVPDRVPVGQKIDLKMKLGRGDSASLRPILYYQLDGGPVQQAFMTRGPDGQYSGALDARLDADSTSGRITGYIEAGDDRYDLSAITVVPRLSIRSISASITPPKYVPRRAAAVHNLANAPAVAAEGSDVAMSIGFNKDLAVADPVIEVIGDAELPPITWERPDRRTAAASFNVTKPLRFRVRGVDVDGFNNTALEEYELIVRPDANLSIQLETPRRSEERTAQAFVPMQAVVEDDGGVEWVTLNVERLSPNPQKWELPLIKSAAAEKDVTWQPLDASPDRVRHRLNYQLE
ncbi:MAG TPA: hypothetical protein VGB55_08030, partial [Tepidisphaeraceae bacterium]